MPGSVVLRARYMVNLARCGVDFQIQHDVPKAAGLATITRLLLSTDHFPDPADYIKCFCFVVPSFEE